MFTLTDKDIENAQRMRAQLAESGEMPLPHGRSDWEELVLQRELEAFQNRPHGKHQRLVII